MKKILSLIISTLSLVLLTAVCFTCLAVSAPKSVASVKYTSTSNSVTLSWGSVKATGYRVYKYNTSTKKWVSVVTTNGTTATVKNLKPGTKTIFAVRAYNKQNGETAWAKNLTKVTAATRPANASGLKASSKTDRVTVSWSKAQGATGYRIYRYNPSTKKWDVQLKATNKTSVTAKDLSSGRNYIFAVKPYYNSGNGILWASKYTQIKTTTLPAKVKGVKVSETINGLKLTWNKVSGATGYNLLTYNTSTKKYTNIGATTTNSITVNDYSGNKIYYFTVRAYKTLDKKVYYGERSAFVKHLTFPTEAQAAAIYNNAYKAAYTWFDFGGNADWNDVKTYNGARYVRVTHKTINTKAKLRSYLYKYFTKSIVDQFLDKNTEGMGLTYRDFGGKLYKLEIIAGDMHPIYYLNKTSAYLVSMNGNNCTFHVKIAYKFSPDESYQYLSERTTFVKENNRWVVGTGDWRYSIYAPYEE